MAQSPSVLLPLCPTSQADSLAPLVSMAQSPSVLLPLKILTKDFGFIRVVSMAQSPSVLLPRGDGKVNPGPPVSFNGSVAISPLATEADTITERVTTMFQWLSRHQSSCHCPGPAARRAARRFQWLNRHQSSCNATTIIQRVSAPLFQWLNRHQSSCNPSLLGSTDTSQRSFNGSIAISPLATTRFLLITCNLCRFQWLNRHQSSCNAEESQ